MLNNIPTVTKNLLILNVLMFLVTQILKTQGIYLENALNIYSFNSPMFQPFQFISSMFMHGDIMHLLLNMFGLVVFGSVLEKVWKEKRFFIFYFICGIGAGILSQLFSYFTVEEARQQLLETGLSPEIVYNQIKNSASIYSNTISYPNVQDYAIASKVLNYVTALTSSSLGASGALFGILAGFAMLFPNTELQLIFPPIKAKAKYFILVYFVLEIGLFYYKVEGDNVNHLAHIGGAIFGAIMVLIWKRDRNNFY